LKSSLEHFRSIKPLPGLIKKSPAALQAGDRYP
jgi:hypothetical protein